MTTGPNDWAGRTLADGRYRVGAKIGEGGMGTVYRATDAKLDAEVVIKVPLRSMLSDPDFARRFEVEVKSLARLSHPQIVKIMDVGTWDGLPFAVMQYLPGGSLEDRRPVPQGGAIGAADPKALAGWLPGIAGALDYLHRAGYVHRDVKPGNILFDDQGHPFLSDFGVVKVAASSAESKGGTLAMTGAGMVVGTPEYMAPELVMGDPIDGRADQYALAATAFEMLSGRRPFEDPTKTKLLVLQTTKAPPSPGEFAPWIGDRLSEAVLRGLAKAPGDRYPDCSALASAVVSAASAEFGEKPDVVRFRCPECRKTLVIAPEKFDRIRASGRPLDCPNCKAPILSGKAGSSSSTLLETPAPRRGTMVEPAPARGSATLVESSPIARSNRTIVERSATVVERSGTVVERPRTMIGRSGPRVESGLGVVAAPPVADRRAPAGRPVALWASIGAISAVAVLASVGLLMSRGGSANPGQANPGQALNPVIASPEPKPRPSGPIDDGLSAKPAEPRESTPPPGPPRPDPSLVADATPPGPGPKMEPAAPAEDVPNPARDVPREPEEGPLTKVAGFVDLKDVRDHPGLYEGKAIELKRLYCLIGPGRGNSSRFAEVNLSVDREGELEVTPTKQPVELELDPGLAKQVEAVQPRLSRGVGPAWSRLMALTVKVVRRSPGEAEEWGVRVIGLEVFQGFTRGPGRSDHTYSRVLHVKVGTRTILADSDADSDDVVKWKDSGDRLKAVVDNMKNRFKRQQSQVSAAKRGQLDAEMDRMMRQMNQQDLKMKQELQQRMRRATGSP